VLPAENRLRRRREFAIAVRGGRRAGRPLLVAHLHVPPAAGTEAVPQTVRPKVGLVVGRTVGSAVVRNTVKRRLRHLLDERLDRLPAGALLVIRVLPDAGHASTAALAGDLDRVLDRLLRQPVEAPMIPGASAVSAAFGRPLGREAP
jgi:ribonuclease P protein component